MKRSPLWCAAFALAWRQLRSHRTFVDVEPTAGSAAFVESVPTSPAEIARWCAAEADACESAHLAAFGEAHADASIAAAVARVVEADPHGFSKRPCESCRAISGLLGRDFGCVARAKID